MAVRSRPPLAVTLPAELLNRPVVPRVGFPFRLLLVLALLPLLLGASGLAIYRQQQADRIYTGIRVFGLDLSRMTRDEAVTSLKRHLALSSRRRFDLRFDEEVITVSLASMGLMLDDAEVTPLVDRAWSIGREDDLRSWLSVQMTLFRSGYDVPVTARFDRERAAAVLSSVTPDVERATLNAHMSVERAGDRFEIHTSPAQVGRRLNVDATIERLQKSMAGTLPTHVDLELDEAPPAVRDEDLVPARETIELLLGSAVEFRDGTTRAWRLEPAAAYEMLQITGLSESRPPIAAGLDEAKLAAFVERTARAADQPAQNPFFAIEDDRVVVRPGRPGKLADAEATLAIAKEKIYAPASPRFVDVVFKEDVPWLSDADLEPARIQANALLDQPMRIETPTMPGVTEKAWVLRRADLVKMIVLPQTQTAPRDYATMPAAARPRFELQLDSGLVASFLGREVAPWVSEDPVDAALELKTTKVNVPNPAYAAAVAAEQRRAEQSTAVAVVEPAGTPGAVRATVTPVPTPQANVSAITVPPTLEENRYSVELRNARDGRGPDYDGTFALMQTMFRTAPPVSATPGAVVTPTATATAVPPTPTPAATLSPGLSAAAGTPTATATVEAADRRVTVRLAPRRPRVFDTDLAPARDQANKLLAEPVTLRWKDTTWTVTRDDLANMLRYQPGRDGKLTAYLTRDGLIAKANDIAREANRLPDAPRASDGSALPLDVTSTAGLIWQVASTVERGREAEVFWTEEVAPASAPDDPFR